MSLAHLVDVARGLIKVHETGRWAHINVKLLHFRLVVNIHPISHIFCIFFIIRYTYNTDSDKFCLN